MALRDGCLSWYRGMGAWLRSVALRDGWLSWYSGMGGYKVGGIEEWAAKLV